LHFTIFFAAEQQFCVFTQRNKNKNLLNLQGLNI